MFYRNSWFFWDRKFFVRLTVEITRVCVSKILKKQFYYENNKSNIYITKGKKLDHDYFKSYNAISDFRLSEIIELRPDSTHFSSVDVMRDTIFRKVNNSLSRLERSNYGFWRKILFTRNRLYETIWLKNLQNVDSSDCQRNNFSLWGLITLNCHHIIMITWSLYFWRKYNAYYLCFIKPINHVVSIVGT